MKTLDDIMDGEVRMETKKMYSAFVSSVYESLKKERLTVIDSLWHNNIVPFCMEYFIVPALDRFSWIEGKIDDSDVFVLLLGSHYGSCDQNGISWTEREYNYAVSKGKMILAIVCKDYFNLLAKSEDALTEDEKKQIAFCNRVPFAKKESDEAPLPIIISQFFIPDNLKRCVGWTREVRMSEEQLEAWRRQHRAYDLGGDWYHVHLSEEDESYIRIGSVKIEQTFDPEHYRELKFTARNYNAMLVDGELCEEDFTKTSWVGTYKLDDDDNIIGIFNSKRTAKSVFKQEQETKGEKRGIHEFKIDSYADEPTLAFSGYFYDQAPSQKIGMIGLFRDKEQRRRYIQKERPEFFKK